MNDKFEVVISGLSGRFPQSKTVKKLEENIYSHENFVTDDETRWARTGQVPQPFGKIEDALNFDATFFRIPQHLFNVMDTNQRALLESSFEAICDSGSPPQNLWDANTAVLIGALHSEPEVCCFSTGKSYSGRYNILGISRCMEANRPSFFYNCHGISNTMVSGDSTQPLEVAYHLVATGQARSALVGSANIIFGPENSFHADGLRRLNTDGKTKSFSADADGYSRSEGTVMMYLQRAEDALRSYGTLVKVSHTTDYSTKVKLSDPPSPKAFTSFLSDFYSDIPIDKSQIGYVEADGTANLYLDALELNAYSEVLSSGRKTALPVGSIKSRMGHSEGVSPFFSMVNALITLKTGYIPPSINYNSPNPHVPGLVDGTLKVVTEKTPLVGDYVAVTSFGLNSTMSHILIKRNPRTGSTILHDPEIPRLFLLSGRNLPEMQKVLNEVNQVPIDDNVYLLNHRLFRREVQQHVYRGYAFRAGKECRTDIAEFRGKTKPLWFVFTGMGSQWNEMGTSLLTLPMFRRSIEKSHALLKPKGLDLISFLTSSDPTIFDNILHSFVSIAAVQVALIDILEELGIVPDGIVGHSVGEFGCAYADKTITAEQTILAAYARGTASNEATLINGMMAAVGKGYKQIKNDLPPGVEVACHNSDSSCTLSGPTELVRNYVEKLKAKGIFCKLVNVANIAYHSSNIKPASPILIKYLKEILVNPKPRSSKWISSSVPEKNWDSDLAKYSSAEYHTNNLLSPVLFEEASAHIPRDAICVEIAPHGLLQAILKRSMTECVHIPLTNRNRKDGAAFFIEALAKLYSQGVEMDLSKLYPVSELPVSRDTDYLQPIVTWESGTRSVPVTMNEWKRLLKNANLLNSAECCWKNFEISENSQEQAVYWTDHSICGSRIYPQSANLGMLMDFITNKLKDKLHFQSYEFKNVKFHHTLKLEKGMMPKVLIYHQSGLGNFECTLESHNSYPMLMTGILLPLDSLQKLIPTSLLGFDDLVNSSSRHLTHQEIYSYFLHHLNCRFEGSFTNISSISVSNKGFVGKAKWTGNAERFIDAILKMVVLFHSLETNGLVKIKSIKQLVFDPTELSQDDLEVEVRYNAHLNQLAATGVRMFDVETEQFDIQSNLHLDIDKQHFLPYSTVDCKSDIMDVMVQVISENVKEADMRVHVMGKERNNIFQQTIRNKYFRALFKTNVSLKVWGSKDVDVKGTNDSIIILSDGELSESHMKYLSHATNNIFLLREEGHTKTLPLPTHMAPIMEQQMSSHSKLVLYKKRKSSLNDVNFIQMKDGHQMNKPVSHENGMSQKTNVFIFTYDNLSNVPNIIDENKELLQTPFSRFMLVEESGAKFDPTNKLYLNQLEKDLKVNICHKGVWGSLREFDVSIPVVPLQQITHPQQPLSKLRCKEVNVKVLGVNPEHPVFPTAEEQLGVMEYAGEAGGKSVFGLGRLTGDHYLEVDQELSWTLPSGWSAPQAASVPLFYSIAYYLLELTVNPAYPLKSILVHGGHTPFSQAIIAVALSKNMTVYTTCFNEKQKQLVSTLFPQVNSDKIYLLTEDRRSEFVDDLLERTKGGVSIVVDTLRDRVLNNRSLHCIGTNGKYILVCHDNMHNGFSVGMSIFFHETFVTGCNPHVLLELNHEEKKKLHDLVEAGIRSRVVRPLDTSSQPASNYLREEAVQLAISTSQQDQVKKVLLTMDTGKSVTMETKTTHVIVGGYNSIWFDVMCWLVSKGANSIHVAVHQKDIPSIAQMRVNNFIKKHKHIDVEFISSDKIATPQSFEQVLQKIASACPIEKSFYITNESKANWMEGVLRKHTSGNLIYVGKRVSEEVGKRGGSKVLSLVLKNSQCLVRNRDVVNILEKWTSQQHAGQNDDIINVNDELQEDAIVEETQDLLPRSVKQLVDLGYYSWYNEVQLDEIKTTSRSYEFAKEVDVVIMFPGFQRENMVALGNKLLNPTFLAAYPSSIGSIDQTAKQFAELLNSKFNQKLYTLVAEGWSGPLVLKVAEYLEMDDIVSQIILLDSEPICVMAWNDNLAHTQSIIAKHLPSYRNEDEEVTLLDLKEWAESICQEMANDTEYTPCQVNKGFSVLLDRLEAVQNYSYHFSLTKSKVDFFSPASVSRDLTILNAMCGIPLSHHKVEDVDWPNVSFLKSQFVHESVMKLATCEFKHPAKPQDITTTSSLRPMYYYEFHAKGIYPPNHTY